MVTIFLIYLLHSAESFKRAKLLTLDTHQFSGKKLKMAKQIELRKSELVSILISVVFKSFSHLFDYLVRIYLLFFTTFIYIVIYIYIVLEQSCYQCCYLSVLQSEVVFFSFSSRSDFHDMLKGKTVQFWLLTKAFLVVQFFYCL